MCSERNESQTTGTALLEAVETLSKISELEFDQPCAIVEDHALSFHHRKFRFQTVRWFHRKDGEVAFRQIKSIFRSVLHYLCRFYGHHRHDKSFEQEQVEEGIRKVIELVGEAAKRLDRFSNVFKQSQNSSVTTFKEYRELQHYYREKLVPQVDERLLSRWILSLSQIVPSRARVRSLKVAEEAKHIYVDLESVTKDTEYELFYLKKEDGSRFFNPRLLRNMKVVSDLERTFATEQDSNPLLDLPFWQEELFEERAKQLLKSIWAHISAFYKNAIPFKNQELAGALNKAMMALFLASRGVEAFEEAKKGAVGYFRDFLYYLNDAFNSEEFLSFVQTDFHKHNVTGPPLVKFLYLICNSLYCKQDIPKILRSIEEELVALALVAPTAEKQYFSPTTPISQRIHIEWNALNKLMRYHPNGALHCLLQDLQDGNSQAFSPWQLLNLPFMLWNHSFDNLAHHLLHVPFPIVQQTMTKGEISAEFSAFLQTLSVQGVPEKYLMINLQDRTSWKEHLRCYLIENYCEENPDCDNFAMMTLAIDTDFYHQLSPYDQDNHAEIFVEHFLQHLLDDNTGFYFSSDLKKSINKVWLEKMLDSVHQLFFEGRNVLTREKRLDFIQIAYLFLVYKALESFQPNYWSFTCKDGIDVGASFASQMFFLTKFWSEQELSEEDYLKERSQLFLPALLLRERSLHPDRFYRFFGALRTCESCFQEGHDHFRKQFVAVLKDLYSAEFIKSKITWGNASDTG